MIKKSVAFITIAAAAWIAYKVANSKTRGISENLQDDLTDFSGFSLGNIQDTLTGEFMRVGGLTGFQVNGGASASFQILAFLKGFEKFRAMPYFATEIEQAKGIKTVGYGHVILPLENFDKGIDEATASMIFANDVSLASEAVINAVKVELNQNQFDALVSLVFNVGGAAFRKSRCLKKLNNGDFTGAMQELLGFNKQGGVVLSGLVRRRNAEKRIFESADYSGLN